MRKRPFAANRTVSKKTRRLASAATLLPLAIGLAGTQVHMRERSTPTSHSAVQMSPDASRSVPSFETGCGPLPFQGIAVKHPIDDNCGIEGVTSPNDVGNKQQNRLKNNFCIHSGSVIIHPADLISLQADVDALPTFRYGSGRNVPKNRSPLKQIRPVNGQTIGEGSLVTLVGYMVDPHYSDVRKGEGVNCKQKGKEPNDIHFSVGAHSVELSPDRNARRLQLCELVIGEISPHYRPASWEVEYLDKVAHIPVRLRGQLFFDASHVPCRPGKIINPARKSVWEIHPLYAIDVCKSPRQCRGDVDSDWLPLDKWVDDEQHEEVGEPEE